MKTCGDCRFCSNVIGSFPVKWVCTKKGGRSISNDSEACSSFISDNSSAPACSDCQYFEYDSGSSARYGYCTHGLFRKKISSEEAVCSNFSPE